jgi:adenosine deaminase
LNIARTTPAIQRERARNMPSTKRPRVALIASFGAALILLLPVLVRAQTAAKESAAAAGTAEQRAARAYEAARANPLDLEAFLWRMPKGADLHYHQDGGIYPESYIRVAAEDGLCVDLATHAIVPPQPSCGAGQVAAAQAFSDQNLYNALMSAFSMRGFVPTFGTTGRDHFFDTFGKFSEMSRRHEGEWLDEIATRAAAQNEQYLEIMVAPDFSHNIHIANQIGWRDDLAQFRDALIAQGLRGDVAAARAVRDEAEGSRRALEHCGTPEEAPACKVTIRYIFYVLRDSPKEQVFAQTLLGFEVASADPRFVGLTYVEPEDNARPMADYALHMKIVGYLHGVYPKVHVSLHAGELAPGFVPPEGLCCHIRLAVEMAHSERIGHGVDVMYEDRPYDLLKEMAAKHVMVEINLTSNDLILGVTGKDHPLPIYRKFHVPVALSTDDEGVSRINLTHEYVRAAETYALSYADLKQMVRTGLEHNFLSGTSLWREPDAFTRAAAACAAEAPGAAKPSAACAAFLKSSEKAQQQWELERRFREFESGF